MDISILEDIGLTGAEIKVFIALLELGPSSAGKVVEKSGLQNAVVHRAFHSLAEKGLITYVYEGKIKIYQTIDPKLLLDFIEEKKKRLEKLLPELEAKRKLVKEIPRATLFHGIRGIKNLLYLMLETKSKEYFAYGGPQKALDLLKKHFWAGFHKKRISKKIAAHLLFHTSLKEWGDTINKWKFTSVRYTGQDFEELTETIICGSRVGIIIYLDKPFGFLIEEETAVKSYKKFFELLWEQDVRVYKGTAALKALFDTMAEELKQGDEWLVLGASKWSERFVEYFKGMNKIMKAKKTIGKLLFDEGAKAQIKMFEKDFNVKTLPKQYITPAEIDIYHNKVLTVLWTKTPRAWVVENKAIADSYRKYFEIIWRQAEK